MWASAWGTSGGFPPLNNPPPGRPYDRKRMCVRFRIKRKRTHIRFSCQVGMVSSGSVWKINELGHAYSGVSSSSLTLARAHGSVIIGEGTRLSSGRGPPGLSGWNHVHPVASVRIGSGRVGSACRVYPGRLPGGGELPRHPLPGVGRPSGGAGCHVLGGAG